MTIERARIIKASSEGLSTPRTDRDRDANRARILPREILEAKEKAAQIVAEAESRASEIAKNAATEAATEAREAEVARLAANFLALEARAAEQSERDRDRLIELATVLAERVVGEALRVDPSRVAELAASAIQEARGATRIQIDASPDDVEPLRAALGNIDQITTIQSDPSLPRGSLVVHTNLGTIDARLTPQLTRLAAALKEALR